MNPLRSLVSWVGHLFRKGVGDKVFARLLGGFGPLGLPGSWSQHRREQAQHFRGWPYIVVRTIAEEIAAMQPQVAYIRQPEEQAELQEKSLRGDLRARAGLRRYVKGLRRRKSMAPIQAHEELELVDSNHRLMRLLHNPNGPDTQWTFWYRTIINLDIFGNAYWWVIPDGSGKPCEMWALPAQWMWASPIREPDEIISAWEVRPYGTPGGAGTFTIPADEIIHFQYPHILTFWDGLSPLSAGAAWIDILESIDACQWSNFKQGVRPGLIVELDPQMSDPDDPQMERLLARLNERRGEGNAGKPMVLSPGAKVVQDNLRSATEMDYTTSSDQKRDWILALYGVSKFMVGITEDVNKATSQTAYANFFRKVARTRLLLIDGVATEKLARRIDPDLVIYHEDPTADDGEERRANFSLALQGKAVTPNEIRTELLGLEPFPNGGDSPIGTPSDVPLPYGEDAQDEAEALGEVLAQLQAAKGGGEQQSGAEQGNPLAALLGGPGEGGADGSPANRLPQANGNGVPRSNGA